MAKFRATIESGQRGGRPLASRLAAETIRVGITAELLGIETVATGSGFDIYVTEGRRGSGRYYVGTVDFNTLETQRGQQEQETRV